MLTATLTIELDTNAADAVRGALAKTASELVVQYGLAGEVKLLSELSPRLPDENASDGLRLSRKVAVSPLAIRTLISDASRDGSRIEIDYRDTRGDRTTRQISDIRVRGEYVYCDDHLRDAERCFLFTGIERAEVVE